MKHQSPNPVHPRLRGELCQHSQKELETSGSSPLTRGTPYAYDIKDLSQRFIPAYAGNSCSNCFDSWTTAVHPRLRGELSDDSQLGAAHAGSSPLTRGTRVPDSRKHRCRRFIPAYAGNSFGSDALGLYNDGSSPLTRGTRLKNPPTNRPYRFIPAYAGNSLKQGIEHLTNSSKDFLSGKYAKNPETVLNHFKNSSLD